MIQKKTLISEKKIFKIENFTFENGRTIPIRMGYETFGSLNEKKDNAILVVHYFSASSHCAGKYNETDAVAGFWDSLIGPGKAVDTDRYFVICSDNICNVGVKNPMVYTSGPSSVNPETGNPYALDFPVPSVLDVVNSQKLLLRSLGITHLHAVMGPSFGGMTSLQWAVSYPDFADRIIPVICTPILPVLGAFSPLQHAIRVAEIDKKWNNGNYYGNEEQPDETLHLSMQMMNTEAFFPAYYEETYKRTPCDNKGLDSITEMADYEKALYDAVNISVPLVDLNHWLYTSKMCMNYDLSRYFGGDRDAMLSSIKARVLSIPCEQDRLHPTCLVKPYIDRMRQLGVDAQCYSIRSNLGHMAGILETHLFADQVRDFINN